MSTKLSSNLLRVCIIVGLLAIVGQAAFAQGLTWPRAPRLLSPTPALQISAPGLVGTPIGAQSSLHRYARWPARSSAFRNRSETITSPDGKTIINNTNVVIVRPPHYGYYGGFQYYRPWYPQRPTYTYYERGIYNAMMPPFGLSSRSPLR